MDRQLGLERRVKPTPSLQENTSRDRLARLNERSLGGTT